jgi:hypothetical protein
MPSNDIETKLWAAADELRANILAPVPSEQFFVLILTGVSHRTGGRDAGQARTVEFPEEGRRGAPATPGRVDGRSESRMRRDGGAAFSRDDFIAAGIAGLKGKTLEEVRIAALEKKIGQQAMELELHEKKDQFMRTRGVRSSK